VRPIVARVVLLAFFVAAAVSNARFHWFRTSPDPSLPTHADHRALRAFVERVGESVPAGSAVFFVVPEEFVDEEFVPRRFQYLLPGRQVLSSLGESSRRPDFRAEWRVSASVRPDWQLIWRSEDGSLWARVK
jgi:hypothetical protein